MIQSGKKALSQARMVKILDVDCRQRVVEERDENTCQRCGSRQGEWTAGDPYPVVIQWSHVHSRRHYCLRWDDDNSKALCRNCHCWWTNNPGLAYDWFMKKWPERWERITRVLQLNPKVIVKHKLEELRAKA